MFLLIGTSLFSYIGELKIRLPQCIDLIFAAMLFMEFGNTLNKINRSENEKHKTIVNILGIFGFFIWSYLSWHQGIYIELATRQYHSSMLCVVVAMGGCLSIIQLSESIENLKIFKIIAFIGRYSLELLCIHSLDSYLEFIWRVVFFDSESILSFANEGISVVIRLLLDLVFFFLFIAVRNVFHKTYLKNRRDL